MLRIAAFCIGFALSTVLTVAAGSMSRPPPVALR